MVQPEKQDDQNRQDKKQVKAFQIYPPWQAEPGTPPLEDCRNIVFWTNVHKRQDDQDNRDQPQHHIEKCKLVPPQC